MRGEDRAKFMVGMLFVGIVVGCTEPSADSLALAGGGEPVARVAAMIPEVTVRTRDFAFDMPDSITSGRIRFRLVNEGPDFHHLYLVRLDGGHTLDEFVQQIASGGPPPSWAVDVGGPQTPGAAGMETNAIVDLDAGNYAVLCVIPGADGVPHVMKGMMKALTVVPGAVDATVLPTPDVVMTLADFSFETDVAITPGVRTIQFQNIADQPHEAVIVKLAPGRTPAEFVTWVEKREGDAPGQIVGGITNIARGEVVQISAEFEPGEYALICFVPDATDGIPHVGHGMLKQITVG